MKREKKTYVDQIEHLSHKFVTVRYRVIAKEPLPSGHAWLTASMIASLAAELTSVARPLVRPCVVPGGGALPLVQLGVDLALNLYLLLLEHGGAVAGPPADDDGSAFFRQRRCRVARLTGLDS
jgi:hypothetical protein